MPAYSLLYAYIIVAVIVVLLKQIALRRSVAVDIKYLIKRAYLPSISVLIVYIPLIIMINMTGFSPLLKILVALFVVLNILLFIGFRSEERKYLYNFIKRNK